MFRYVKDVFVSFLSLFIHSLVVTTATTTLPGVHTGKQYKTFKYHPAVNYRDTYARKQTASNLKQIKSTVYVTDA